MKRLITLLLVCYFLPQKALHAQAGSTSIAIFPFSCSNTSADYKTRASQIQQSLIEILRRKPNIAVIDRSKDSILIRELDIQIREQSIAAKGLVEQGKLLGARQMIVGTLSNISVEHKRTNSIGNIISQKKKTVTEYNASISFALQLTDIETGQVISQKVFNTKDLTSGKLFNLINMGTGETEQEAIENAINASKKQVSLWINESYPPEIKILKVDEKDKKGNPETVLVSGIDESLQKGTSLNVNEIEMIDAGNGKMLKRSKKIAELKIKEIQEEITICKVVNGAEALEDKMKSGAKMEFTVK